MTRRTGAGLVVTRAAWTMSAWDTSPGTTPSTRAGAAGDELAEGGFRQPQEGAHDAQNRLHGARSLRHRAGRFAGYGAVVQGAGIRWAAGSGWRCRQLFEAPAGRVVDRGGRVGRSSLPPAGWCGSAGGRRWLRWPSSRSSDRTSSRARRLARCRGQRFSPWAQILQVMRERRRGRIERVDGTRRSSWRATSRSTSIASAKRGVSFLSAASSSRLSSWSRLAVSAPYRPQRGC